MKKIWHYYGTDFYECVKFGAAWLTLRGLLNLGGALLSAVMVWNLCQHLTSGHISTVWLVLTFSGAPPSFLCPLSPFTHLFIISHTWGRGKPFYSHRVALLRLCCQIKASCLDGSVHVCLQTGLCLCVRVWERKTCLSVTLHMCACLHVRACVYTRFCNPFGTFSS